MGRVRTFLVIFARGPKHSQNSINTALFFFFCMKILMQVAYGLDRLV